MYWSGVKTEDNDRAGVPILVKEEKMKYIKNDSYTTQRLLSINIKEGKDAEEYTLIVA